MEQIYSQLNFIQDASKAFIETIRYILANISVLRSISSKEVQQPMNFSLNQIRFFLTEFETAYKMIDSYRPENDAMKSRLGMMYSMVYRNALQEMFEQINENAPERVKEYEDRLSDVKNIFEAVNKRVRASNEGFN